MQHIAKVVQIGITNKFAFININQYFLMYAPINESVQTRVNAIPSYKTHCWEIEPGKSYQL
ncbi:MAG: hypothetical protein AAF644_15165, partial [Pseudomonadota bacterium]